jgi:3-oxoacyl-[acyl-carrier-protein] synthase-3
VFKFAVRVIPRATKEVLKDSGHTIEDLAWLVPHQANQRIISTVEERLGIDDERVFCNLDRTGNTSSASIPMALDELYTSGRLSPGDLVALVGFGAGLTWGAAVIRWTMDAPAKKGQ